MTTRRPPVVGLALGSGSARGWAHIGVLRALLEAGVRPQVVCGASVGAIVGAAYATGQLDRFEEWVRGHQVPRPCCSDCFQARRGGSASSGAPRK